MSLHRSTQRSWSRARARAASVCTLAASFGLLAGGGCHRPPAQVDAPTAVPVELLKVAPGNLQETTELSGVLEAIRAVDVVAEVSGKVATVRHDVGDAVQAGEVLASLDTQVMRETLNQAEAALLAAEAREALVRADLSRDSTLFDHGDIPQAAFDASRMAYTAALAELKAARASRELAGRTLREADIRAPFAGVVSRRHVDVGAYLGPGMPAFRVVDVDSLRLVVNVAQHHVGRLTVGGSVWITVESMPGQRLAGTIRSIAPEADAMTRTFPVEVMVANPPGAPLRSGLIARVALVLGLRGESISVPREAVIRRTGANYVFVVTDSTAHQRLVTVGALIGNSYVIERGVNAGDLVVTAGVQNLHDGVPVVVEHTETSGLAAGAGS